MKERLKTMVNSAQLFILTGIELDVNRVAEMKDKEHPWKKTHKCSLQEISSSGLVPKIQSTDERFDRKCPVLLAVESLWEKGLPKHIIEKVMKQKSNAEKGQMVGSYRFLNNLITREHKKFIDRKLNECWKYYNTHAEMP